MGRCSDFTRSQSREAQTALLVLGGPYVTDLPDGAAGPGHLSRTRPLSYDPQSEDVPRIRPSGGGAFAIVLVQFPAAVSELWRG